MRSWKTLLVVVGVMAGCGGGGPTGEEATGKRISDEELCQFQYGATKVADVTSRLGTPSIQGSVNGAETIGYQYWGAGNEYEETLFDFDVNGVLLEVKRVGIGAGMGPSVPSCLSQ